MQKSPRNRRPAPPPRKRSTRPTESVREPHAPPGTPPETLGAVYLAPYGLEEELVAELNHKNLRICFRQGRLIGTIDGPRSMAWAQNTWLDPFWLPVRSIADAAARLKEIQRNWALYAVALHRRAALVEQALPPVSARPLAFPAALPTSPLGAWTLWNGELVLASARCSSPFVNGEIHFQEDKLGPPNRAYLKLWETFTRIGKFPGPGDVCLDLGSSPGGWTWVLAKLGAHIFSLDKAPLTPELESHPLVEHCIGSAFALEPQQAGNMSWLFSDVACYPERLYTLVKKWTDAGVRTNMVCTIKFSGTTDFAIVDAFRAIPGSMVLHLFANKHELTFVRLVE